MCLSPRRLGVVRLQLPPPHLWSPSGRPPLARSPRPAAPPWERARPPPLLGEGRVLTLQPPRRPLPPLRLAAPRPLRTPMRPPATRSVRFWARCAATRPLSGLIMRPSWRPRFAGAGPGCEASSPCRCLPSRRMSLSRPVLWTLRSGSATPPSRRRASSTTLALLSHWRRPTRLSAPPRTASSARPAGSWLAGMAFPPLRLRTLSTLLRLASSPLDVMALIALRSSIL